MMNRHLQAAMPIVTLLNLGCLVYLLFKTGQPQKIGVVQMETLVYEFQGMKDATSEYASKLQTWSAEIDSLAAVLDSLSEDVRRDSAKGEKIKLREKRFRLGALQKAYLERREATNQQAAGDDQTMTVAILNQLKSYIREFAEKQGYDVILANHQTESAIYVSDTKDITKAVLDYSNARYNDE
ncbi:MAG: OmpH family outer membrane protein [Bacteroidota bacterium]